MKLSADLEAVINEKLIIRINELYHDLENKLYHDRQGTWQVYEQQIFRKLAEPYIKKSCPVTCLDFGSGTGFVAMAIGDLLQEKDRLICTDLSQKILEICRQNIEGQNYLFQTEYVKMNGRRIPAENGTVDIITVNAVLHHVLDLDNFAQECRRVLKADGMVIVGHEPNGDRRLPWRGRIIYRISQLIFRPSTLVFPLVEKSAGLETGLRTILSKLSAGYRKRNKMLEEISDTLLGEGLTKRRLRGVEVQQLVDYHTQHGFTKSYLTGELFYGFELLTWRSYSHLGLFTSKNLLSRAVDRYMANRWPDKGETLGFVMRKCGKIQ